MVAAMAGRSTPGTRPMSSVATAIAAPVFPALNVASASPDLTICPAMTRDELRFLRIAWTGCSPMPITSGVWRTDQVGGAVALRRQFGPDGGLIAQQHDLGRGVLPGDQERAPDHFGGGKVAAHRIHGDSHTGATYSSDAAAFSLTATACLPS